MTSIRQGRGRTKINYGGVYLDDATRAKLELIHNAENERLGARLTMNQILESLINRFPLVEEQAGKSLDPHEAAT